MSRKESTVQFVRSKSAVASVDESKIPHPTVDELINELSKPSIGGSKKQKIDLLKHFVEPLTSKNNNLYVRKYIVDKCSLISIDLREKFEQVLPPKVDWTRKSARELSMYIVDLHEVHRELSSGSHLGRPAFGYFETIKESHALAHASVIQTKTDRLLSNVITLKGNALTRLFCEQGKIPDDPVLRKCPF